MTSSAPNITFSTCFYAVKSKFNAAQYAVWIRNFLSIVHAFYLVIYTDEASSHYLDPALIDVNPRIRVILRPLHTLHNYRYREHWIANHAANPRLRSTGWELNMVWAEKAHFVRDTATAAYFDTDTPFHGWCDIGYFRNTPTDTPLASLQHWGRMPAHLAAANTDKICYACVNNDDAVMTQLCRLVRDKTPEGMPRTPLPLDQVSFAGGCFVLPQARAQWWADTFDTAVQRYFAAGAVIKDDQIIVADCILSHPHAFTVFREHTPRSFNNWFMFQRILNQDS